MSNHTASGENAPSSEDRRSWPRGLAMAPLWIASVLVLAMGIAALGAYLTTRQPDVVERVLPPPPPPGPSAETMRRLEALRALNGGVTQQIEALRRDLAGPPQCPPGTAFDPAPGSRPPS